MCFNLLKCANLITCLTHLSVILNKTPFCFQLFLVAVSGAVLWAGGVPQTDSSLENNFDYAPQGVLSYLCGDVTASSVMRTHHTSRMAFVLVLNANNNEKNIVQKLFIVV